jgi:hypothetical protein
MSIEIKNDHLEPLTRAFPAPRALTIMACLPFFISFIAYNWAIDKRCFLPNWGVTPFSITRPPMKASESPFFSFDLNKYSDFKIYFEEEVPKGESKGKEDDISSGDD